MDSVGKDEEMKKLSDISFRRSPDKWLILMRRVRIIRRRRKTLINPPEPPDQPLRRVHQAGPQLDTYTSSGPLLAAPASCSRPEDSGRRERVVLKNL